MAREMQFTRIIKAYRVRVHIMRRTDKERNQMIHHRSRPSGSRPETSSTFLILWGLGSILRSYWTMEVCFFKIQRVLSSKENFQKHKNTSIRMVQAHTICQKQNRLLAQGSTITDTSPTSKRMNFQVHLLMISLAIQKWSIKEKDSVWVRRSILRQIWQQDLILDREPMKLPRT